MHRLSRLEGGVPPAPGETFDAVYLDSGIGVAVWEEVVDGVGQIRYAVDLGGVRGFGEVMDLASGRILDLVGFGFLADCVYATEDPSSGRVLIQLATFNGGAWGAPSSVTTLSRDPATARLARDAGGAWAVALGLSGSGVAALTYELVGGAWIRVDEIGELADPQTIPDGAVDAADVRLFGLEQGFVVAVQTDPTAGRLWTAFWSGGTAGDVIEPFSAETVRLLGIATEGSSAQLVARADDQLIARAFEGGAWGGATVLVVLLDADSIVDLVGVAARDGRPARFAFTLGDVGVQSRPGRITLFERLIGTPGWFSNLAVVLNPGPITELQLVPTPASYVLAWNEGEVRKVQAVGTPNGTTHTIPDAVGRLELVAATPSSQGADYLVATAVRSGPTGRERSVVVGYGLGDDLDGPLPLASANLEPQQELLGLHRKADGSVVFTQGPAPESAVRYDQLAEAGAGTTGLLTRFGGDVVFPPMATRVACAAAPGNRLLVIWDERDGEQPLAFADWVGIDWSLPGVLLPGRRQRFWDLRSIQGPGSEAPLVSARDDELLRHDPAGGPDRFLASIGTAGDGSRLALAGGPADRFVMAYHDVDLQGRSELTLRGFDGDRLRFEQHFEDAVAGSGIAVAVGERDFHVVYRRQDAVVHWRGNPVDPSSFDSIEPRDEEQVLGYAVAGRGAEGWVRAIAWSHSVDFTFDDGASFTAASTVGPRGAPSVAAVGEGALAVWLDGEELVGWSNAGPRVGSVVLAAGALRPSAVRVRARELDVEVLWLEERPDVSGSRLVRRRFDAGGWGSEVEILLRSRPITAFDLGRLSNGDLAVVWIEDGAVWGQVLAVD